MSAVFKANPETLAITLKFGGAMLGILLLIWLIALLTPKAAAIIDKLMGKKPDDAPSPERVEDNNTAENYEVHSFFEDVPIFHEKSAPSAANADKDKDKE